MLLPGAASVLAGIRTIRTQRLTNRVSGAMGAQGQIAGRAGLSPDGAAVILFTRMTIRSRAWYRSNTYGHAEFPPERLAAGREQTVSICLPARNEAGTICPILEQLLPLRDRGVVDQVVVVDRSNDGTADSARNLGAEVHDQDELMP